MQLIEPGNEEHEEWLKTAVFTRTLGLCQVQVKDLLAALPSSKLPLYVFLQEVRTASVGAHEDPETAMLQDHPQNFQMERTQ